MSFSLHECEHKIFFVSPFFLLFFPFSLSFAVLRRRRVASFLFLPSRSLNTKCVAGLFLASFFPCLLVVFLSHWCRKNSQQLQFLALVSCCVFRLPAYMGCVAADARAGKSTATRKMKNARYFLPEK